MSSALRPYPLVSRSNAAPSGCRGYTRSGAGMPSRWDLEKTLKPLAVKLQAVDDLVDHLALGAHGKTDQIEIGVDHRPHRLAVCRIMGRPEHVRGIDGGLDVARQRPPERAGQRRPVGAVDQDGLADQRQVSGTRAVLVRLADAFRKAGRDPAGQKAGNVQLLPRFEVG